MSAKILTVDDSASIRLTTKVTLTNAGYEVTEAVNGAEGLDKAKAGQFDLIVTDLNMPVMDGLTMIRGAAQAAGHMGVPIIFLTTESDADLKAQAKAAGATGWLTKPFDPENLVKIVSKVLGKMSSIRSDRRLPHRGRRTAGADRGRPARSGRTSLTTRT